MSKEKQIEEKHELSESIYMSGYGLLRQDCDDIAEQLYHEGYHKQSEGEWITDEEGYVTCSVCGEEHTWDEFRPPYCDMCGAKMKGGAE
jgi:hypothetical protein